MSRHAVGLRAARGAPSGERPGHASAPAGQKPAGAEAHSGGRQLRDASASFHVVDGRMTLAALAGSGW